MHLSVAFDAFLPVARWAPLFHVLCLEQPGIELAWRGAGLPTGDRSLLDGADVGLFVTPPAEPGLDELTLDTGPMAVTMAVGHRLARREGLTVADILDEPFARAPDVHPRWRAFWTLDERRGGPPSFTDEPVQTADQVLELVVSGRAIATVPGWIGESLPHPGAITLPLLDGPPVQTRLVWRSAETSPAVRALVELAAAWSTVRRNGAGAGETDPT
jgi:DNA-binding transcriptional LysR family regulator